MSVKPTLSVLGLPRAVAAAAGGIALASMGVAARAILRRKEIGAVRSRTIVWTSTTPTC
jgi:hypothetical protein